jgi:fucose 4-O-acetylase-like acetyltransferase
MPAFIFVSAYFSKKNPLVKLVKNLLVPYIIFQFIYFLFGNLIWHEETAFELFHPDFTLWFLLSLFWWRVLIDKVLKVKGILYILFALGILIGFDTSIGTFGSLERTVAFFPYFVLGYQFDRDKFMKIADRKAAKVMSAIILITIFTILYYVCDYITFDLLTMKYSYKKIELPVWGWLNRTALYALSTSLLYLIAVIIPRKRHWFTYLGERTLGIYLIHGLIYRSLEYMTNIYDIIDTNLEVMLLVISSGSLTFLLSIKPINYLIKMMYRIPLERLLINENNRKDE